MSSVYAQPLLVGHPAVCRLAEVETDGISKAKPRSHTMTILGEPSAGVVHQQQQQHQLLSLYQQLRSSAVDNGTHAELLTGNYGDGHTDVHVNAV